MTAPTAKELLEAFCRDESCDCVESQMAARVERVLALHTKHGSCQECVWSETNEGDCPTVRILNGEEP